MSMVTPGVQASLDQIAAAALAEQIRNQSFWIRILCALVTSIFAVTGALVGVIYFGMNEHLKSLDDKFQIADRSAVKVEELFTKSPKLEQMIYEMHEVVSRLPAMQLTVDGTHDAIIRLQDGHAQIKEQLNNMQQQIHQIPGMHK